MTREVVYDIILALIFVILCGRYRRTTCTLDTQVTVAGLSLLEDGN